jgi:carboxyl-terminal processing protease
MYLRFILILCLATLHSFAIGEVKPSDKVYYNQFYEVFEQVKSDYVQEPDKQKMIDAAISGMLTSLDPHSTYFTDEDLEDFINQTKGEFGGIGIEVMYDNGAVKVITPIDDLPADKAGIRAGDYIVGVNDELVSNLGFHKSVKEMRGEPGTKVKLLVIKEDETKPKEIELVREIVKIKPVKAHLEKNGVAYVRIVTFNENTIDELKKAITKLKEGDKNLIKGIILDLRNNPGGLLNQAVAVSEYFIDSGVIVSTKGRTASSNSIFTSSKFVVKAPKVPLIVIINSGSASAAEIVAGAIQDHRVGLLIGTKSFGKGSVQTFMQINSRSAVKLTTAKYYTPSGRSIQGEGIEPDIVIEPAKVEFTTKLDEKRFSESSLKNYLKNDKEKDKKPAIIDKKEVDNISKETKDTKESKETKNVKEEQKQSSELYKKDYQFARAYDLILGLILSSKK